MQRLDGVARGGADGADAGAQSTQVGCGRVQALDEAAHAVDAGENQPVIGDEPANGSIQRSRIDGRANFDHRKVQDFGPVTVEPDHFFVMGDHRDRSSDSRSWGQVPRELLKGRALLIWWSYPEHAGDINLRGSERIQAIGSKLLHFFDRSRWSRCFSIIA